MGEITNKPSEKITTRDLFGAWVRWIIFNHVSYNYEVMQGLAIMFAFLPLANILYEGRPEEEKAALERQMMFFNTEVTLGCAIVGLSHAMEAQIADGEDVDPEAVIAIKSGLMGPVAGIGDTLQQAVTLPLLISIAISLTTEVNAYIGPILVLVVMHIYQLGPTWFIYKYAYDKGNEAILGMLETGVFNKIIDGAGIVGCTVMGALIASYITFALNIQIVTEYSTFDLQTELFDAILPNALPLGLTMGCMWLMGRGWKTGKIIGVLFVAGFIFGAIGVI